MPPSTTKVRGRFCRITGIVATLLAVGVLQSINVQARLSERGRFAW